MGYITFLVKLFKSTWKKYNQKWLCCKTCSLCPCSFLTKQLYIHGRKLFCSTTSVFGFKYQKWNILGVKCTLCSEYYRTNKIACIDTKIVGLMKWSVVLRSYCVVKQLTSTTGVSILQENLNYSRALCVVYKILAQILPQLQKLQVQFNQGCRSVFDMGVEWFCVVHWGVSGGCAPLRSWKILYFWNWNRAIWWVLLGANLQQVMISKNQFYRPDWPKFCILGVILVKIVSKNWKSAVFWPKYIDLGWIV